MLEKYAATLPQFLKLRLCKGKEGQVASGKKALIEIRIFLLKEGLIFNRVITLDRNQKGN